MCPDTQEEKQLLFLAGPTDLIRTLAWFPRGHSKAGRHREPAPFRTALPARSVLCAEPSWPAGGAGAQEMAPAWPTSGKLFNRPVHC